MRLRAVTPCVGRQSCDETGPNTAWRCVLDTTAGADSYIGVEQAVCVCLVQYEHRRCGCVSWTCCLSARPVMMRVLESRGSS